MEKSAGSATGFICNICGKPADAPLGPPGRESAACPHCGSVTRTRAMMALLAEELFGIPLLVPEFPTLKGIRGMGMSDAPDLAGPLEQKFNYINTFYHQSPRFDVTNPDPSDFGRYDFIFTADVLEHIPPPVEEAFATLYRMLKPDGLLVMTVPYAPKGTTVEHFPELYQYTLTTPGDKTVLVNRRRDGTVEVFDDLVFHGGPGSTVEMRVFSEDSLRKILAGAGFQNIHVASENRPEFGIEHVESWSLPIVARKGRFAAPMDEFARAYQFTFRRANYAEAALASLQQDYDKFAAFHKEAHEAADTELATRLEWVRRVEAELAQEQAATQEILRQRDEALAELESARKLVSQWENRKWTRIGRKLGLIQ